MRMNISATAHFKPLRKTASIPVAGSGFPVRHPGRARYSLLGSRKMEVTPTSSGMSFTSGMCSGKSGAPCT